ncbi:MAG TPA: glycosyltransferase [Nitrosomonas sp.]|nr:glycosyltransferase [Nitrosomonas sp.]
MNLAKAAQAMSPIKDIDHQQIHNQKVIKMKIGIIINSRLGSSRIPNKALALLNGIPMISHLISRLEKIDIPIYVAVPNHDYLQYLFLNEKHNVYIHQSIHSDDPLARMNEVAIAHNLDYVIRITHDKIFVDTELIKRTIYEYFNGESTPDYIYLNDSIPGTAFEIISAKALKEAARRFKNVEYIGYAIREVTNDCRIINAWKSGLSGLRLLVDYPSDLKLMQIIFSQLGNDCSLNEVCSYLLAHIDIATINRLPKITVYTCAYNAGKWLDRAIQSVAIQKLINFEYILIDDSSTDQTIEIMAKWSMQDSRIRFIRTDKNIGLASASNLALKEARGEYIIRLDADDWFANETVLASMLAWAQFHKAEITYPDFYSIGKDLPTGRHSGHDNHHVGGALFHRAALNYVKFTEGLRGHDSLDVFIRARDLLRIGYFTEPTFFYYQHAGSLSKNNLKEREQIKAQILRGKNA